MNVLKIRLADQGHIVVGVEIAPRAVKEFFEEQQLEYTEEKLDNYTLYKVRYLCVFV